MDSEEVDDVPWAPGPVARQRALEGRLDAALATKGDISTLSFGHLPIPVILACCGGETVACDCAASYTADRAAFLLASVVATDRAAASRASALWEGLCAAYARSVGGRILPRPWSGRQTCRWRDELLLAVRLEIWPEPREPPVYSDLEIGDPDGLCWHSLQPAMIPDYIRALPSFVYRLWSDNIEDEIDECEDELVFCFSALWRMTNDQTHQLDALIKWLDVGLDTTCLEILRYHTFREFLDAGQNYFVPYYAAAILGTLLAQDLWQHAKGPAVAKRLLDGGFLDIALSLARGALSFEEQRLGARLLHHICSFDVAAAALLRKPEAVPLLCHLSRTVVPTVVCSSLVDGRLCSHVVDVLRQDSAARARPRIISDMRTLEACARQLLDILAHKARKLEGGALRDARDAFAQPCVAAAIAHALVDCAPGTVDKALWLLEGVARLLGPAEGARLAPLAVPFLFSAPGCPADFGVDQHPEQRSLLAANALRSVATPALLEIPGAVEGLAVVLESDYAEPEGTRGLYERKSTKGARSLRYRRVAETTTGAFLHPARAALEALAVAVGACEDAAAAATDAALDEARYDAILRDAAPASPRAVAAGAARRALDEDRAAASLRGDALKAARLAARQAFKKAAGNAAAVRKAAEMCPRHRSCAEDRASMWARLADLEFQASRELEALGDPGRAIEALGAAARSRIRSLKPRDKRDGVATHALVRISVAAGTPWAAIMAKHLEARRSPDPDTAANAKKVLDPQDMRYLGRADRASPPGVAAVDAVHCWLPVIQEWARAWMLSALVSEGAEAMDGDLRSKTCMSHMSYDRDAFLLTHLAAHAADTEAECVLRWMGAPTAAKRAKRIVRGVPAGAERDAAAAACEAPAVRREMTRSRALNAAPPRSAMNTEEIQRDLNDWRSKPEFERHAYGEDDPEDLERFGRRYDAARARRLEPWCDKYGFEDDALRYDDPPSDVEVLWDGYLDEPIDAAIAEKERIEAILASDWDSGESDDDTAT